MNSTAQPTATTPLVLVVEDEPAIASILTAYLERDGLRSRMASDGQEALQLFRLLRPDLVLLDIHLPGMDGIDVLRAIRDDSQTPVIMVTALADDVDKLLALRLGADDYVVKPFNPPEVVARVRAVLRRTQARKNPAPAPIRVGPIEIDAEAHSAVVYDNEGRALPLPLTLTEFRQAGQQAEFGQLSLQKQRLDLAELVAETLDHLHPQLLQHGMQLEMHLPAPSDIGMADIRADADRMRQILSNLVSNAI